MKNKYSTPLLRLEEFEKKDVLLESEPVQSIEENQTQAFSRFLSNPDWFNYL